VCVWILIYINMYNVVESWSIFFLVVFWLSFLIFFYRSDNFLSLLIYSEVIWLVLYTISIIFGISNNDINIISLTFLSLGLAGLEFSLGLVLVVFYKNNTGSINL
jgi:NADH:ubiquinone oxidoreductase subunit K